MPAKQPNPAEPLPAESAGPLSTADVVQRLEQLWPAGSGGQLQPSPERVGHRVGRYSIRQLIGNGAFGVVYLAYDPVMDREVALKIPLPGQLVDRVARSRFLREARAAGLLNHPNVIPVFEAGTADSVCYIASEYYPAKTLAAWLADRSTPVPTQQAAEIVRQLADAVEHAHRRGVIHRDLKPGNVLLGISSKDDKRQPDRNPDHSPDRQNHAQDEPLCPRIIDFGLAYLADENASLTRTGMRLGTTAYMSPEQTEGDGKQVMPATDIFCLGIVLFELLTQVSPFERGSIAQTLAAIQQETPRLKRQRPDVPRNLEAICLRALAKDPAKRYPTAGELAEDLQRFTRGIPVHARHAGRWEKTVNWCRHHPAWASLITVVLLSVSSLSIGALWHANRLSQELAVNKNLRIAAETQQAQTRRARYLADMRLANRALLDGLPGAAGSRLEHYLPPSPDAVERDFPWFYLWKEYQHSLRRFLGHRGAVSCSAIGENSGLLVSSSHDKTVRFFDIHDQREIARITDYTGQVNAVALSPNERVLFTGADSGELFVYDVSAVLRGGEPQLITKLVGHADDVFCVAISPDGKQLASAGADGTILIWELPAMKQAGKLEGHTDWIRDLDFSPDGSTLASISHDDSLIVWNVRKFTEIQRIKIADGRQIGLSVGFHPSGKFVAAGNSHGEVRMIRLSDNKTVSVFGGHVSWFRSLDFSDDGRLLAVAGNDPFVRLLRVNDQMQLTEWRTLPGHRRETWSVQFVEETGSLLSSGLDGTTVIRNIGAVENVTHRSNSLMRDESMSLDEWFFRRLTTSSDRSKMFLAGNHAIKLIDSDDLQQSTEFEISVQSKVKGGAVSLDGRWVGCLRWSDIRFARTDDMKKSWGLKPESGATGGAFSALALHPFSDVMAAGTATGEVSLVKLPSRDKLHAIRPFGEAKITDVMFTSDGRFVAACFCNTFESKPATVVVWDAESFAEIGRVDGVERLLAVSPHDHRLALVNCDLSMQLWNIDTKSTDRTLGGHTEAVISADFSPDGEFLASTARSGPMKIWSTDSGQLVLDIDHDLQQPQFVFGPGQSAYATDLEILSRQPKLDYRHRLVPLLEQQLRNQLK